MRPAEDLRLGDYLAFERDRDQPFRITPVQGDEYGRGHHYVDLVWGQVTQLGRLGSGGGWWRPPTFLLSVSCSFASDASLITTLFNHSPVLLRPSWNGLMIP
ncbi:hypothetical protein OIE13_30550 [Streptosporangium sp. NBC_01810]|uniref:hypothetical protein n=1 Tax=Streptosporangium sp. NBC_01810 TaxID=2975951 RepID=UPI002DDC1365|nr:hypothetical protein [Streptosporangium sp. NBC_01810]WSA25225.1 hypothetical protein OIE13_30550 [Streptosporangium sp. NBC_01810]